MERVVAMHQPNYLPWIGLFSKISKVNLFVIMDCIRLGNTSVTNRNKIRTNGGEGWIYLTIPVGKQYGKRIVDVQLPGNEWQGKHWITIRECYAKAKHFGEYAKGLEEIYAGEYKNLAELNVKIISLLLKYFDIKVDIVMESQLEIDPALEKTDLLITTLERVNAQTYISGPSGKDYIETQKFEQNKIDLKYFQFQHPVYEQRFPGFVPNMSAIDLLFNKGTESCDIIRNSGAVE